MNVRKSNLGLEGRRQGGKWGSVEAAVGLGESHAPGNDERNCSNNMEEEVKGLDFYLAKGKEELSMTCL